MSAGVPIPFPLGELLWFTGQGTTTKTCKCWRGCGSDVDEYDGELCSLCVGEGCDTKDQKGVTA